MDSLSVSLVNQYLSSTNSSVAEEFKSRYQPGKAEVTWMEVVSKWKEDQLVRGLVCRHLKQVASNLAHEFLQAHQPTFVDIPETLLEFIEVEMLSRNLAYQLLQKVSPTLAPEFKRNHFPYTLEIVPGQLELWKLVEEVFRKNAFENSSGPPKEGEGKSKKSRLGIKIITFTEKIISRIEKALEDKEDLERVAKELGRSYKSIRNKAFLLKRNASLKSGRFSAEEITRMKEALSNNEDYIKVAKELHRTPNAVKTRLQMMESNPRSRRSGLFTTEEDITILERIFPRLRNSRLSGASFLSQVDLMELAKAFQRAPVSVRLRWERILQPWLLQDYTGTSGLRVERMLTRLVAEKFKDHRGINWSELVREHKEFAGHTGASIGHIFWSCRNSALRCKKKSSISLQEVAEHTADVYQPGKERKVTETKEIKRRKFIMHFKSRLNELGIKIRI